MHHVRKKLKCHQSTEASSHMATEDTTIGIASHVGWHASDASPQPHLLCASSPGARRQWLTTSLPACTYNTEIRNIDQTQAASGFLGGQIEHTIINTCTFRWVVAEVNEAAEMSSLVRRSLMAALVLSMRTAAHHWHPGSLAARTSSRTIAGRAPLIMGKP